MFSGVGIRRKRSKRSALRCIALCFFEKTVTCELESVELVGRVLLFLLGGGNGAFSLRFGYFLPQYVLLMYLPCIVKYFTRIRIDRRI